jgi:hypothetical protein
LIILHNLTLWIMSILVKLVGTLTDGCPNLGPFSKYAFGSRS